MSGLQKVQIANTALPVVEYRGQRVVTFAMIDQVHARPERTARRNFTENKARFIEGDDFYLIDYSKRHEFRPFGIEIPTRGLMVLTETGYLMLVKSFTDDLAWEVQRQLVSVYFRAKQAAEQKTKPRTGTRKAMTMAAIRSTFKNLVKLQGDFSREVDLPHALAAAQNVMLEEFGVDMTRLIPGLDASAASESTTTTRAGDTFVKLDTIQPFETKLLPDAEMLPSALGALFGGYTAQGFNKILYALGYQERHTVRGKSEWHPTAKGAPFAVITYVPRAGGNGADVAQLLWKAKILDALQAEPAVQQSLRQA